MLKKHHFLVNSGHVRTKNEVQVSHVFVLRSIFCMNWMDTNNCARDTCCVCVFLHHYTKSWLGIGMENRCRRSTLSELLLKTRPIGAATGTYVTVHWWSWSCSCLRSWLKLSNVWPNSTECNLKVAFIMFLNNPTHYVNKLAAAAVICG